MVQRNICYRGLAELTRSPSGAFVASVGGTTAASITGEDAPGREDHSRNVRRKTGNGAWGRIRTTDTRIFNPLLYQLSYPGEGPIRRRARLPVAEVGL